MKEKYILTKERKSELEKELKDLQSNKRKEIADRLDWYRNNVEDEESDPGYSEALEEKDMLEERIFEIQEVLDNSKILQHKKSDIVILGSFVNLLHDKKTLKFQIVTEIEADPEKNKLSSDSPLGKKLLGHKAKDAVSITTPKGKAIYTIISVS